MREKIESTIREVELKVQIIAHTPDPERVIASSAKLCYSQVGIDEINENMTDEEVQKFLNILINMKHFSPSEHASFTFAIEGVSRALLAQITRHRMASFSVVSQRYVNLKDTFQYIMPEEIRDTPEAIQIYKNSITQSLEDYTGLFEILQQKYINSGMSVSQAEKKAIENARYVLPNASETKLVVTMNARELMHFFSLRCCSRSQDEIRELADEMLRQVKKVAPTVFKKAGATCTFGACSEGKMSCGKPRPIII